MALYDRQERNSTVFYPAGIDLQPLMRRVYLWMGLGTLLTAFAAAITTTSPLANLVANPAVVLVAIFVELGLVVGLTFGLNRLSPAVALVLFFAYAVLNGFTLSIVLLVFSIGSVISAFVATAVLFGVMSIIGYTTKLDLAKMGTYLIMGVIGLVIAMVVNLFINSGPLDLLISVVGVLIFTGLTAYDTQRIRRMAAEIGTEEDVVARVSILGALTIYLDFINMFLFMLRLMGNRRR